MLSIEYGVHIGRAIGYFAYIPIDTSTLHISYQMTSIFSPVPTFKAQKYQ